MEHKPVRKKQRKYDAEFKKEVLKMIESGRSVPEVAQSLGIGSNLIYYWKKQLNKPSLKNHIDTTIVYDDEKTLLQKRIKELETERDILKKALGIFSRPI
jgi:transposase